MRILDLRSSRSTLSDRCQIFTSEMYSRRIDEPYVSSEGYTITLYITVVRFNKLLWRIAWMILVHGGRQRSWWQNCLRIEYVEKLHFRQRTCRSLGRKENEIFRWYGFGGSSSILFRIVKHTAMSVDPFSLHLFSPHPLLMLCQKLNLRTESKMLEWTKKELFQ